MISTTFSLPLNIWLDRVPSSKMRRERFAQVVQLKEADRQLARPILCQQDFGNTASFCLAPVGYQGQAPANGEPSS